MTYRNVNLIEGFLLEPTQATQASRVPKVINMQTSRSRSFSPRSKYKDPTTDACLNHLQSVAHRS